MKSLILFSLAATISANILFTYVHRNCSWENPQIYHGCMRGQQCFGNESCLANSESSHSFESYAPQLRQVVGTLSPDGRCGIANGGMICDPTSTVYTGSCCSGVGWCGNTPAHCGTGCQSGCLSITTAPRADARCGIAFENAGCDPAGPFGGCCSTYGWCGFDASYCFASTGCQSGCTDGLSVMPLTGKATKDGLCGVSNGDTVCDGWADGNCCSIYGYCGNSSAHCGAGCQSGDCISAPSIIPPGPKPASVAANGGKFEVVGQSGVPAMHAALLPNGRVFFLDKIENYTQLILPNGQHAYSSEYNPDDNTCVPLAYTSNAFCSGGAFLPDGRVLSLGGNAPLPWLDPTVVDGFRAIRYLDRSFTDSSLNGQNWNEPGNQLASARWYATAQVLPDGKIFVASGSLNGLNPAISSNNNPTYEILSNTGITEGDSIQISILQNNQPYYMYPFVHLLNDGSLFIFVSKSSVRFSLVENKAVQTYPDLPGDYRTYPNTGGSVLLPFSSSNNWNPDIIICGGGAYQDITSPTEPSCGRISPHSAAPTWEMDSMPEGRGMVEGVLLPDGTVLFINGGSRGAQGFGLCTDPALEALLYNPTKSLGQRWSTMASSTVPRLYHSCALLLLDGTVLIAGSNPVQMPVLIADANNPYPTEFRVEIYTPPYLQGLNADRRPANVALSTRVLNSNGSTFAVTFTSPTDAPSCNVVLYHGGYVTHSLHMSHRMLQLDSTGWDASQTAQIITVIMPPSYKVCPPGPYVVFVVCDGVPAIGQFVMVA